MKTLPTASRHGRCIAQCAFASAALFLGACSATTSSQGMTERHGSVKFSSAGEKIEGQIAIRHDADHFHAKITKADGAALLTISAKFGTDPKVKESKEKQMVSASVSGPLAHGSWTWRPLDLTKKDSSSDKLKDPSRAWAALPEVFMWGEAEANGAVSRVTLPDVVMHARAGEGHVKNFDYSRHENPTGQPLPMRDLKKQRMLESVICHLD